VASTTRVHTARTRSFAVTRSRCNAGIQRGGGIYPPIRVLRNRVSYVGSRRYLVVVVIVIKSQSQSQGRNRGEERSTYATPRAFACSRSCKRSTIRWEEGGGELLQSVNGPLNEVRCNCYVFPDEEACERQQSDIASRDHIAF